MQTSVLNLISFVFLFLQATFKGWMDIMYAAVDSRDVSRPTRSDKNLCAAVIHVQTDSISHMKS